MALGARYLQEKHGLERIAIVDWDVHHGNGTQHLFETDPSVLYIPYTKIPPPAIPVPVGKPKPARDRGREPPSTFHFRPTARPGLSRGDHGDVLPALEAFRPDCLMISAGFDAHRDDPLAHMNLTQKGYMIMGALLGSFAKDFCGSRIITVLEGGYNLAVLEECVFDHIQMLLSL